MTERGSDDIRRIGRNLRLRDLHTLMTVVRMGSMARAARELGVTQPAISQAIADLEAFVGARLLDRSPRGVSLTAYGEAMTRRGAAAFDSLHLGLRDVAFLATSGAGTVSVAADMSFIASGMMAEIILHLRARHPLIDVHVVETTTRTAMPDFRELRAREVDLMLGRLSKPAVDPELAVEMLLDEELFAVVGADHRCADQPDLTVSDLAGEAWILASSDNLARATVEQAFREAGVVPPSPAVTTYSMALRMQLLASGRFVTVMPDTAFRHGAERWRLTRLPIPFPRRLPVALVMLKERSPTPAAALFTESVRQVVGR